MDKCPSVFRRECGSGGEWSVQLFFRFLGWLYNDPSIMSAEVVFVQGIDRSRLDMSQLERSSNIMFCSDDDGCLRVSLPCC